MIKKKIVKKVYVPETVSFSKLEERTKKFIRMQDSWEKERVPMPDELKNLSRTLRV